MLDRSQHLNWQEIEPNGKNSFSRSLESGMVLEDVDSTFCSVSESRHIHVGTAKELGVTNIITRVLRQSLR